MSDSAPALEWTEVVPFGDLPVRAAARYPDADAVIFPDSRHTYATLNDAAVRAARSLAGLGLGPGDHLGILMPNCMDYVEVIFGAAMLGAWVVPINARYKEHELAYVIENADLKLLITSDLIDEHVDFVELLHRCLPRLAEAPDPAALSLPGAPKLQSVILLGARSEREAVEGASGASKEEAPAGMLDRAAYEAAAEDVTADHVHLLRSRVRLRDVAMMMYTSGTTADPKGCPLTHEALVRTSVNACGDRFELTAEDRFWDPLPLFHMSAILPLIGCMDSGAAYITLTHFEPGLGIAQLRDERATVCFSTFPPITTALLNHPEWDAAEFSRIRLMNNVAPPDALRRIHAALPTVQHTNAYGLTECGGVAAFSHPDDPPEKRPVTSGRPLPGIELQIRDPETGAPVDEPNTRGEIWMRGYCVFEGYYKDPAKNAECFDADGWFNTGDLGALDEGGRVSFMGRLKDMLKVGGENVAALEIESYLQTHPAVNIAQVVGIPDDRYDEVPAAFVELVPGAEIAPDDLIAHCRGRIASFKVPRHVRFVAPGEWPMSATKVQKYRLRDQLLADLGN